MNSALTAIDIDVLFAVCGGQMMSLEPRSDPPHKPNVDTTGGGVAVEAEILGLRGRIGFGLGTTRARSDYDYCLETVKGMGGTPADNAVCEAAR